MSPLCISANCFFKSQTRLQRILHFLFCFFSMPRDRKRITDRGVPLPILSLAAAVVSNDGRTVRSVAKEYSICHTTLYRFIKKRERLCPGEEMRTGYWPPKTSCQHILRYLDEKSPRPDDVHLRHSWNY